MLALYALDRPHEALGRYRSFRMRLDEELGLEPTAETRALEAAVIRQEDVHSLLPRPIRRAQAAAGERAFRLLGRVAELEALTQAVRNAIGGGVALIQIEGETGLGKTRLIDELSAGLEDVRVGRASCSELERHLPYVPLAAALRDALTGVDLDAASLPALSQILPELALVEAKHEFNELDVLEALVALIVKHAPLVLLLDDLQWADPQTLAALEYLRRRGGDVSAAFVTAARATDVSPEHPLRRLKPDALVALEPLSPDELAPLGIPGLYESTGGNPRFVTETLANGRPAALSPTLTEALLAQCRGEGTWGYRVLVAASVLRQPFEPEPLAELLGTDAGELTEELERLCERRILRIDGLRFRFRYDLVRRALLGSISPARQRLLHQRLAALAAESSLFSITQTTSSMTG
jgi:predicted ATPase